MVLKEGANLVSSFFMLAEGSECFIIANIYIEQGRNACIEQGRNACIEQGRNACIEQGRNKVLGFVLTYYSTKSSRFWNRTSK